MTKFLRLNQTLPCDTSIDSTRQDESFETKLGSLRFFLDFLEFIKCSKIIKFGLFVVFSDFWSTLNGFTRSKLQCGDYLDTTLHIWTRESSNGSILRCLRMIKPVIWLQILNLFHGNLYWGLMVCMHMTLKTLRGGPPRPPTPHVSQVETLNLGLEFFQFKSNGGGGLLRQ